MFLYYIIRTLLKSIKKSVSFTEFLLENSFLKSFREGFRRLLGKYTNEMKLNAVHLVQNEGRRACDVADELGIDRNTLYAWLRDARNGKLSTDDPAREVTPEQAEISRLRAELARSRQECALLKKFAAYLSTTGLK